MTTEARNRYKTKTTKLAQTGQGTLLVHSVMMSAENEWNEGKSTQKDATWWGDTIKYVIPSLSVYHQNKRAKWNAIKQNNDTEGSLRDRAFSKHRKEQLEVALMRATERLLVKTMVTWLEQHSRGGAFSRVAVHSDCDEWYVLMCFESNENVPKE